MEEICQRPAEALDEGALVEIKAKMSAHIRNCAECQENFKIVKEGKDQ